MAQKPLSANEILTAKLIAKGLTNPQIAKQLEITENVVRKRITDMGRKLHISGRQAIVSELKQRKLI